MGFDAIILAGGRGSRLGTVAKHSLRRGDSTLLQLALGAAAGARRTVVVGDCGAVAGVTVVRESPVFAGPAAAVAAGLAELGAGAGDDDTAGDETAEPFTLVLACDMPGASAAVEALLAHSPQSDADAGEGMIAVDDDGRDQYLLALYPTNALARRLRAEPVEGASMRGVVSGLALTRVPVPAGSTRDVDTWLDAEALGVTMRSE